MASWWTTLLAETDPRIAVIVAAAPALGSGIWTFWQWRSGRADKRVDVELSREQFRAQELDKQQATFGAEQSRWFGDLRQENRDLRSELAETRKDRDRGWDLARWWHGAAHDLLRQYRNLRHNALNMQQWIQAAVITMRSFTRPDGEMILNLPETIDPIPDRIELPMALEDPK